MHVVLKAVSALPSKQKSFCFKVLNQPSQFAAVLQARQRLALQPEARFIEFFYQSSDAFFGLGMVVSRRVAPLAVTRNMIKRQWREAFRSFCLAPDLSSSTPRLAPAPSFNVVLRAKPALKSAYQQAKREKKLPLLRQQIRLETQALLQQLASLV